MWCRRMGRYKRPRRNELLMDYYTMEKMSKELLRQQKNVKGIGRRIARKGKTGMEEGLVEDLNMIAVHMSKARRELDKARKKLELL